MRRNFTRAALVAVLGFVCPHLALAASGGGDRVAFNYDLVLI